MATKTTNNDTSSLIKKTEHEEAVSKRKEIEEILSTKDTPWIHSPKALEAERAAMTILATKTGMYARIPLTCKGEACPYSDTCQLLPYDLAPEGEFCPVETAQIKLRAASYANDIDFDAASFTDRNLMSEIVGYDIMLERCRALLAQEGTPVVDIVIGVSDKGDEIRQPSVSKAWEAYERIVKKRNEAYQLMMMTRKDNKNTTASEEKSISEILASAEEELE